MKGRPYSALGEVMDDLARERRARGPYRIANYIKSRFPDAPSGVAVAKWMYGDSHPDRENLQLFVEAFELSEEETMRLALAYLYPDKPPEGV